MSSIPPAQEGAHAEAKRAGTSTSTGAGKIKPRNLFDAKHPKNRIHNSRVPCPGNILPNQFHIEYAKILNKNMKPINGVEFAKLNDHECRNLIPFSSHSTRDNSNF